MSCCGRSKKIINKAGNIAKGFTALATGKKFEFTDKRIRTCRECDDNYWIKKTLWCSICHCFVPAKARVPSEHCPKGKWENTKEKKEKRS